MLYRKIGHLSRFKHTTKQTEISNIAEVDLCFTFAMKFTAKTFYLTKQNRF